MQRRLQHLRLIDSQGNVDPLYKSVLESAVVEMGPQDIELVPPCKARDERGICHWMAAEAEYGARLAAVWGKPAGTPDARSSWSDR